jgi:DNA end-binding protein Ku
MIPMAAIWEGSIGFGLVEIPVLLKSATTSEELSATMLDKRDLSPVGYRRYNKRTGVEVPWNDIVRGFEYEKDQYVVLTEEELRAANPKATRTVDIVAFVDAGEIDPVYWERPYYLEPRKRASKAYALLRDTLKRTGKVGIARVVLRTRQHVAAVIVRGDALVLALLRYAHELREVGDLDVPKQGEVKASPTEQRMAEQLVGGMSGHFHPGQFKDEYHDELVSLIEEKARSGKLRHVRTPAAEKEGTKVVDLMDMLKESVERTRSGRGRAAPAPARRRAASRAPSGRPSRSRRTSRRSA